MEAVHADWKEYLNLVICEESHLKYMEDYHQFHKDMKDAQELLHKVGSDLNQKYRRFKDRYQIELLLRELDDQKKVLDKYEDVVRGLQKRGQQVVPLKYRRETPLKPIPLEALCDFEGEQGLISRGYGYTLQKNNGESWELTDSAGNKLIAPAAASTGVCSVQQKAAGSNPTLQRAPAAGLDKVASDLYRQEKAITGTLRPPLEQGWAVQDSAEWAKDLKNITNELLQIEPEKTRSALPGGGTTPLQRTRVEDTNRKYERLVQLMDLAQEKADVANRMKKSLQQGWESLATQENRLNQDTTVPESSRVLDNKGQELAALASELRAQKSLLREVERNLQAAKQCSSTLASRFQEHCPDLERQEAEVHKLGQRFDNLCQQVERRAQSLRSANAAYEDYHSGHDHMLQFLASIPR
ncbi:hypothetical protein P7K49_005448 [Saguinus oedipus]|uniref:Desmoplakin SH3 domain-containing protein n=1 Tax=Saguinus oedipus TaxID=9490 RepID=A0ABQ9WAC1_SAGOE|nr:hypothetical protein P7K49_005448 [Saguinus oedipus]